MLAAVKKPMPSVADGIPYKNVMQGGYYDADRERVRMLRMGGAVTEQIAAETGLTEDKTMLNVGKTHDTVRVVNDQIGTPTYTYDLARLLVDMNETEKYGYYHATNEGATEDTAYISWYDFTKEIYRQAGYKTEVLPVTTAEYGLSKAARPFNSRLDKSKLVEAGFKPLPSWQDALSRYLKEIEF